MKRAPVDRSPVPSVVIAIPLAGPLIYWRTVAALLEMEKPGDSDLMFFQGSLIDRARNHLVEQMLAHPTQPTHLFFLDSDMVPSANTLTQLLAADKPIVSGLYRKRLPPHEPMAFVKKAGKVLPLSKIKSGLQKVHWVGGGCLLIRREVFKKVKPPWFAVQGTGPRYLSEDFYFCEKAQKAGFKIWLDPSVKPLHLEPLGIGTGPDGKARIETLW